MCEEAKFVLILDTTLWYRDYESRDTLVLFEKTSNFPVRSSKVFREKIKVEKCKFLTGGIPQKRNSKIEIGFNGS